MLFFFQYMGVGLYFTFLNVFFRQAGLSGTQIGTLNMVNAAIGVGASVVWGYLSDRTGKPRILIMIGALGAVVISQFVPVVHGFLAYLVLGILNALLSSSIGTLLDSTTLAMLGARREDYGKYRLGGTFGYILTASTVGFLFDRAGLRLMFPMYGVVMAVFMATALLLPNRAVTRAVRARGEIGKIIRQPTWIIFTVSVFLTWIATNASIMFLGVVLQSMGASQGLIGLSVTIGAVVEIPFMAFSGKLLRRFGPEKLLLFAISLNVVRFFLLGQLTHPVWAVAINALNGPAFVLLWNSAVNLANRLTPPGLTGTGQGLFNSTTSLAAVVSSLLAGLLFDRLGVGMFTVMSGSCLAAALLFGIGNLSALRLPAKGSQARLQADEE